MSGEDAGGGGWGVWQMVQALPCLMNKMKGLRTMWLSLSHKNREEGHLCVCVCFSFLINVHLAEFGQLLVLSF